MEFEKENEKKLGIEPGSPDEVGKGERKKSGIEPGSPDENIIVFDFLNRFLYGQTNFSFWFGESL
jgi:hypothetical protein